MYSIIATVPEEAVVLVKCHLSGGGFPTEVVFRIQAPGGGNLHGTAPRDYCFDKDKKVLSGDLPRQGETDGYVAGLALGAGEEKGTERVQLPDGDVYEVAEKLLDRKGVPARVPVKP